MKYFLGFCLKEICESLLKTNVIVIEPYVGFEIHLFNLFGENNCVRILGGSTYAGYILG